MSLGKSLIKHFAMAGWFREDEISSAVDAILASVPTDGWRWSVGTPGSVHFVSGFAISRGEAEDRQEAAFNRILCRNPVLGSLDTEVHEESARESFGRLSCHVAERLQPRPEELVV